MNLLVLAIVLILAGLVMALLGQKTLQGILGTVVYYVGVVLVVVGLVLLLTPVFIWLDHQFRAMLA